MQTGRGGARIRLCRLHLDLGLSLRGSCAWNPAHAPLTRKLAVILAGPLASALAAPFLALVSLALPSALARPTLAGAVFALAQSLIDLSPRRLRPRPWPRSPVDRRSRGPAGHPAGTDGYHVLLLSGKRSLQRGE